MHVVALGHDKKIFDQGSRSFARQAAYAAKLSSLHIIIPTKVALVTVVASSLFVHPVVARNPLFILMRLFLCLYRQVRSCQALGPTVLIVQSPFEFGLLGLVVAALTGVPLQVQVHGDFYSQTYWQAESWGNRVRARIGLCVLRRAAGVRVVSARIAASLQARGVSAARITVLPIEADLGNFFSASPAPIWPVEPGVVQVLSVGRFAREKNLPLLISAFYEAHRKDSHCRLVLIGEGPEESKLRALVARLWPSDSPVTFYPWQPQVAGIMAAADIYALSSDHEGYAMVLGEALACGVPVVTTDVGCAGELVVDEVHGLVVPPRDVVAYTEALNRLIRDASLRAQYGAAGRDMMRALERSSEAYTEALVATWQSLISQT